MSIEIKVTPTRELFFDSDSFFGIYAADVKSEDRSKVELNRWGNISIKGVMPRLDIDEEYIVNATKDSSDRYKGSYNIESILREMPETVAEQKAFLETILTENQVKNIYEVYSEDDDVVGMIQENEFDYSKVHGVGEVTYEKLRKKVLENMGMSEVLTFLSEYGIKYNMIYRLVEAYGNPSIVIQKVKDNPYILTEVSGIGFKRADEIALMMGHSKESKNRIDSCIRFCVSEEAQSGHSWTNHSRIMNKAVDLLEIDRDVIESSLEKGVENIVKVDDRYANVAVYNAEKHVSRELIEMKSRSKKFFDTKELDTMIDEYCEEHSIELEARQRQFFHDWNENNVMMLVGGGGVGKSWLQNILLNFVEKKTDDVVLLAPTGRASKVMESYTGRQAYTIHRRIGLHEGAVEGMNPITERVIIVDEASMCDIFVVSHLLKAIENSGARLLFVGDDFQLPSVGVGNFLYDIINSNSIKVTHLKKVFRQAEGGILNVATDVREGNSFIGSGFEGRTVFGNDCVFWMVDQEYIKDGIVSNYKKAIKKFDQEDVVILTPTNRGDLGTASLNKEIQAIANPPSGMKKERRVGRKDSPTIFRVGDAVMNNINTYGVETVDGGEADVFNGDTGKIIDIDDKESVIIVDYEGIKVKVEFKDVLRVLTHSWAMTIHKSQGSSYKVVIVVADRSATFQLNANLLYTGFSRAEEYMLVLGQAVTINRSMRKFANMERRSFLQELLVEQESKISG